MNQQRLMIRTEKDEGRRNFVYLCPAGFPTIGIGRNLKTNPIKPDEWDFILKDCELTFKPKFLLDELEEGNIGLLDAAIDFLFKNDLDSCEKSLRSNFSWFESLDDPRQECLINLCFQIGIQGLLGFHNMIKALSNKDFDTAAYELTDSRYWREREKENYAARAERHYKTLKDGVI